MATKIPQPLYILDWLLFSCAEKR